MNNLVNSCLDRLPKWEEVKGNIPILVTGSMCVAFYWMSKKEKKKSQSVHQEHPHQRNGSKSKQTNKELNEINSLGSSFQSFEKTNSNNNKHNCTNHKHHQSELEVPRRKSTTTASTGPSIDDGNDEEQKTDSLFGVQTLESKKNYLKYQGVSSLEASNKLKQLHSPKQHPQQQSLQKRQNQQQINSNLNNGLEIKRKSSNLVHSNFSNNNNSVNSMNSSEYEFFNNHRLSQGEEEEQDELIDRIIGNNSSDFDRTQIFPSKQSQLPRSSTLADEKSKKRNAFARISKNFATDTENNEKIQKLKTILQKEKKAEDKVFFQMFLNIVNTEIDDNDNDD